MQKITTFLWFDGQAEEAMNHYVSIFKNSKVLSVMRWPKGHALEGSVLVASFELDGVQFQALNGGPQFKFTEAVSLSIDCKTQEEVDHFWSKLTEGGAAEPMRLAEGQVRPVLAGGAGTAAQAASGPGQGQGRPGDAGDDADGQDRRREDRRGGEGVS